MTRTPSLGMGKPRPTGPRPRSPPRPRPGTPGKPWPAGVVAGHGGTPGGGAGPPPPGSLSATADDGARLDDALAAATAAEHSAALRFHVDVVVDDRGWLRHCHGLHIGRIADLLHLLHGRDRLHVHAARRRDRVGR